MMMTFFCSSDWMKAPIAYWTFGPIFDWSWANLRGSKRASIQSL